MPYLLVVLLFAALAACSQPATDDRCGIDLAYPEPGWVACDEPHFRARFPKPPKRETQVVAEAGQRNEVTLFSARDADGRSWMVAQQVLTNAANLGIDGFLATTKTGFAQSHTIVSEANVETQLGRGLDLQIRDTNGNTSRVRSLVDLPNRRIYVLIAAANVSAERATTFFEGFEPKP